MIIRCICHHHKGCNQTKDGEGTTQIYLNSIKSSEVDDANAKILAALKTTKKNKKRDFVK